MLEEVEAGHSLQDVRLDILQAIRFIIRAWAAVEADTIINCWCHVAILPIDANADLRNLLDNVRQTAMQEVDDLSQCLQDLHLADPMNADEYLNPPEEDNIHDVPPMDVMIENLINEFNNPDVESASNSGDDVESPIITASMAQKCLETAYMFMLQQGDAADHVNAIDQAVQVIERYKREHQGQNGHEDNGRQE
jgi:hypothetical protein